MRTIVKPAPGLLKQFQSEVKPMFSQQFCAYLHSRCVGPIFGILNNIQHRSNKFPGQCFQPSCVPYKLDMCLNCLSRSIAGQHCFYPICSVPSSRQPVSNCFCPTPGLLNQVHHKSRRTGLLCCVLYALGLCLDCFSMSSTCPKNIAIPKLRQDFP